MQKYVLADKNGYSADKFHLRPGKTTHSINKGSGDKMLDVLSSGYDSPLLALLTSGEFGKKDSRLFLLNTWKVGIDENNPRAYTVVKETSIPEAGIEMHHKVAFAIAVVAQMFSNSQYIKWSVDWISGKDRSVESAAAMRKSMLAELEAANQLDELSAWGATNEGDDKTLELQRDGERRAMHAATAAEFIAQADFNPEEVCKALSYVTCDMYKYTSRDDLVKLAENIVKCTA